MNDSDFFSKSEISNRDKYRMYLGLRDFRDTFMLFADVAFLVVDVIVTRKNCSRISH